MGTRADFYIGIDEKAEWLGSIAYDGYPDGIPESIVRRRAEKAYRKAIASILREYHHATYPEQGWPWPWTDSCTTDYAYALHDGRVFINCFGYGWQTLTQHKGHWQGDVWTEGEYAYPSRFPEFEPTLTIGSRSGVLMFSIPRKEY